MQPDSGPSLKERNAKEILHHSPHEHTIEISSEKLTSKTNKTILLGTVNSVTNKQKTPFPNTAKAAQKKTVQKSREVKRLPQKHGGWVDLFFILLFFCNAFFPPNHSQRPGGVTIGIEISTNDAST